MLSVASLSKQCHLEAGVAEADPAWPGLPLSSQFSVPESVLYSG